MDPGKMTVRTFLPGEAAANGSVWAKARANYVTFLCRSNKPAEMTFHPLQRGKPAGTNRGLSPPSPEIGSA